MQLIIGEFRVRTQQARFAFGYRNHAVLGFPIGLTAGSPAKQRFAIE